MARNLAERIEQNNEIAKTDDQPPSLQQQIRNMEQQFKLAMPRGGEAAQLVRDSLTCLRQTPKLAECDPATVLGGLMSCAQLGLRPGVLGHAWLIPFWNKDHVWFDGQGRERKGAQVAQLVIGYQGLVDLAHRSGKISSLIARTVYEHDTFDVDYGLADSLVHKPILKGPRGDAVAYYAIAKFTTGGHAFLVMTHDEMVEYCQKHTKSKGKFGPWRDNFESMAHKTCVRQLSKWMPKSTEFARAIEHDEAVRVDLTPDAIDHPVHVEGEVVDVQDEVTDAPNEYYQDAAAADDGMFPA
ncbi:recombination protein RecT [Nocardia cyriacigeorgica]|uniref:recombination protein RecT n=1 Tax=Nocardia cyriacigeorgica TaxID=135487 RepID=UPI001893FB21|nr:recombination protein RecT [Nocardia cyriacigeorgica]MBF6326466.1 recombination protein RecT [Nocardia cyriacigeorgica]